jgi:phosphatidylserine decarboxylase
MKYLLLKLLPKNLFSKLLGKLSELELPSPLLGSFLHLYCNVFKVDLSEIKSPSLKSFKTFNDFFTRSLKQDARPIDQDPNSIVSPVDGKIAEFGSIKNGLLLQSKGIFYTINDLVGAKHGELFKNGYFVTLYLSPADYHRIHTPMAGFVKEFSYFSGNLWPVNDLGVSNVGGLFSLNERVVTILDGSDGRVALVKVGATVVGKITLDYSKLVSNNGQKTQLRLPVFPPKRYEKGDEIGRFQLGSTVILLFEPNRFSPIALNRGKYVKMGQVLGHN